MICSGLKVDSAMFTPFQAESSSDAESSASSSSGPASASSPPGKKFRAAASDSSASSATSSRPLLTQTTGRCELLASSVIMLAGEVPEADSIAARNGKSQTRIRRVIKERLCTCRRQCHKLFDFKLARDMCNLFWGLTKAAQDSILWSMQCQQDGIQERSSSSASASSEEGSSSDDETMS